MGTGMLLYASVFSLDSTTCTVEAGTYFESHPVTLRVDAFATRIWHIFFDRHVPQDRGFSHHHTYRYVCVLRFLACAWPLLAWLDGLVCGVRFYPIPS